MKWAMLLFFGAPVMAGSSVDFTVDCTDLSYKGQTSICVRRLVQANQELQERIDKLDRKLADLTTFVYGVQDNVNGLTELVVKPRKKKR